MTLTAGIDIGAGSVKAVLFEVHGGEARMLAKRVERLRRRDPLPLADGLLEAVVAEAQMVKSDLDYVATTGKGETVPFATGHFYSMTTHARGAVHLNPEARGVLDVGALHGRAMRIDYRGKVEGYRMTSQCASGSGQFLENIARYLGIAQDEIGSLSLQGTQPEKVSDICAVLAETDVINMVSRGVSAPNILKGIHISMADRLVKLLKAIKVTEGFVLATGGLARDKGLIAAINEALARQKLPIETLTHPDSIFAGAIGAAIWGAFRFEKLKREGRPLEAAL